MLSNSDVSEVADALYDSVVERKFLERRADKCGGKPCGFALCSCLIWAQDRADAVFDGGGVIAD